MKQSSIVAGKARACAAEMTVAAISCLCSSLAAWLCAGFGENYLIGLWVFVLAALVTMWVAVVRAVDLASLLRLLDDVKAQEFRRETRP